MTSVSMFIDAFCKGIIRRLGAKTVGIDPITITTILSTVVPMILNCIQKRRGIQPDQVQSAVVGMCEKDYVKTRAQLSTEIRNRWYKHGQKLKRKARKSGGAVFNDANYILSEEDALELADKTLQEAHSTSADAYRTLAASAISMED